MNHLEIILLGGLTLLFLATGLGLIILGKFIQKRRENIEDIQEQVNTDGD